MQRALLLTLLVAALVPVAGASDKRGFEFGGVGGSIRPYAVSIANDGTVSVSGAAELERTKLTRLQLAELNRVASITRFTSLPASTMCRGALPDVAATFIRVGAQVVRVHGNCVPRYRRLWTALGRAVKLSNA